MSDVLYRLQTHLPNDIIYHCILPLCPKFGITSNTLKLQLKRIYLMKLIASDILIKNRDIKKDIFENYHGCSEYRFQGNRLFLFVNISEKQFSDYCCIYT